MEIIESNKVIAEFMGLFYCERYSYEGWYEDHECNKRVYELNYNTSYDWLMPVVEQISSLPNDLCEEYFWNSDDDKQKIDFRIFRVKNISDLYSQVLEFIQWYNSQPSPQSYN